MDDNRHILHCGYAAVPTTPTNAVVVDDLDHIQHNTAYKYEK